MLQSYSTLLPAVLHIVFSGLTENKGSVYIAVFDQKAHFLQPDRAYAKKIVAVGPSSTLDVSLEGLPPGVYAISCFQDLNGNGKLDQNFFGIPTEPYGFSNNARPKFRAPSWEEARFEWKANGGQIAIKLEKW